MRSRCAPTARRTCSAVHGPSGGARAGLRRRRGRPPPSTRSLSPTSAPTAGRPVEIDESLVPEGRLLLCRPFGEHALDLLALGAEDDELIRRIPVAVATPDGDRAPRAPPAERRLLFPFPLCPADCRGDDQPLAELDEACVGVGLHESTISRNRGLPKLSERSGSAPARARGARVGDGGEQRLDPGRAFPRIRRCAGNPR